MANQAGKATATTLVIPLRRGWATWCRTLFAAARRWAFISAPLKKQSFIHVARWTIVSDLDGVPLGRSCLYFESNFDASMDEYVDVFVQAMPGHMRLVWAGGLGYPGLHPAVEYHRWSLDHANAIQHYYCGYQTATTTEVTAATAVADRLDAFTARAAELNDDAFAREYRALLTEVNQWL